MKNGFDKLAAPYRWMEYVSFGRALERCRFYFLPSLTDARRALMLGDGDGRFTSALLQSVPSLAAVAVDSSDAMLQALRARCGSNAVLATVCADLREGLPRLQTTGFDIVATHFFLDCLTDAEVDRLAGDVTRHCSKDARWVVSEFRVPGRGLMRLPSWAVVRLLYVSFRALTGLHARRLPAYGEVLRAHGWRLAEERLWLGGMLTSELWVRDGKRRSAVHARYDPGRTA